MTLVASLHQNHVSRYHVTIAEHGHHGGHNMYIVHRDWHEQNQDPPPPPRPDRAWGMNLIFGSSFLQMHHEMVKAPASEEHRHMMHESIAVWYQQQAITLPSQWNPGSAIPAELGYDPDPSVYPDEIRRALEQAAQERGVPVEQLLRRRTDTPTFELPRYFTLPGVGPNEAGEPYTGARKLADFRNVNQLGCCIVFPHNNWHGAIGGAMNSTWTAIADPIFYFGVHWHIDRVFDEYKMIQAQRTIRPFDQSRLRESHALESEGINVPHEFTPEQQRQADEDLRLSRELRRL